MKPTISIASRVVDLMAARVQSGHRFSRSCATSATSTASDMAVVMDVIAMTTGVVTATTATTTIATTIGGDEFHSLGTNPHVISAGILPVYPAKGLGSRRRGLYLFNPVILSETRLRYAYSCPAPCISSPRQSAISQTSRTARFKSSTTSI